MGSIKTGLLIAPSLSGARDLSFMQTFVYVCMAPNYVPPARPVGPPLQRAVGGVNDRASDHRLSDLIQHTKSFQRLAFKRVSIIQS